MPPRLTEFRRSRKPLNGYDLGRPRLGSDATCQYPSVMDHHRRPDSDRTNQPKPRTQMQSTLTTCRRLATMGVGRSGGQVGWPVTSPVLRTFHKEVIRNEVHEQDGRRCDLGFSSGTTSRDNKTLAVTACAVVWSASPPNVRIPVMLLSVSRNYRNPQSLDVIGGFLLFTSLTYIQPLPVRRTT